MYDLIQDFILNYGLWAIFLLLFLENVFPVLPSEVVIPLAGFVGAKIGLPLWEVILVASVGGMLGQMPWYWGAKALGYDRFKAFMSRFGRVTTIGPTEIDRANDWFARHGQKAVFFGRITPVVRGLISIPAGLTRMPLGRFLAWSVPGSTLWIIFLGWAGYELGANFLHLERWLEPITNGIIAFVLVTWVYRMATWKRREHLEG